MSETLTRREATLERVLMDLLDCVPHSQDDQWSEHFNREAAALRAKADMLDKRDQAVRLARDLIGYDPTKRVK